MRVLFISNFYPPCELGGWEQNCREIVEHFTARGHVCHVLTSRYRREEAPPGEEGVTRRLHLQAEIHHYRPIDFFLHNTQQERANQGALYDLLETFQPDIVFHWGMWNLSRRVAYWAEERLPGNVAYAVADYWPMQPDNHEGYWLTEPERPMVKVLMSPARALAVRRLAEVKSTYPLALQHVSCVSRYVRNKLVQAGALPHGARVIYNGIDPQPFLDAAAARRSSPDLLRLVYTGGLVPHKGVHTAIEALGILRRQGEAQRLHLTVVGGGPPAYEARLRQRVRDLELSACVTFRGPVPREQIAKILADHDIFLFTSVYEEPIARSVMEAMAAGLAVIGTAVGGQPEILVEGITGLTYPPDDAPRLAELILQLSQDAAQAGRLAVAGRQAVLERFTLERMVDEMEGWLKEIGS